MTTRFFNLLVVILSAGILTCLSVVSFSTLTSKESTLLGIVLTILAFFASWLVSKHFSERSHKQAIEEVKEQHLSNLRTYALNAAEKVNNLSNELARLSVYLQQELEDDEEELTTEELYMSSYERIESAIHIINTLKSVNDTYLSDWKGVIGEELDEKFEEQQQRENELKELVEKVELIVKAKPIEPTKDKSDVLKLSKEINDLRKELNLTLNSVSGTFVRTPRISSKAKKEMVSQICPHCGSSLSYKQRPLASSYKFISCKICSTKLCSTWNETKGFLLDEEVLELENFECPTCKTPAKTELGNFPNSKSIVVCTNCGESNQLVRTVKSFTVQNIGKVSASKFIDYNGQPKALAQFQINENLLEKIKAELPEQPWPKDTHKLVAAKLNISLSVVKRHINELIRRGIFHPQIDGVLFEPIKNGS